MHIDWITATLTEFQNWSDGVRSHFGAIAIIRSAFDRLGLPHLEIVAGKPHAFYEYTFEVKPLGVKAFVPADIARQGMMLTFSGVPLSLIPDSTELLRRLVADNFKITRLDVAHDMRDEVPIISDLADEYQEAHKGARPRKFQFISGKRGDTLYVGARSSNKMLRVYDKGAQQGMEHNQWVRVEIECKGAAAMHMTAHVIECADRAGYEMAMMLDLPDHWLSEHLLSVAEGAYKVPSTNGAVKGNRELWFEKSVLPALKKMMTDDPEAYGRIWSRMIDIAVGD